jgi:dimethylglycine dehydrogenase
MAGFSQGGGVGLMLAQWMVEGECERDVTALDVARYGKWITPGYTRPKVIENYQNRFSVSYPNEELPAARPHRTTMMYDIFSDLGAVWGHQFGLEVVNYFAEARDPTYETPTFRRSDAWNATRREVKLVRGGVGINEVQNFGKFSITGDGARAWLDRVMAGRIPQPGRMSLTPMLSPKGRLWGDFTVSCLSETEFQLTASYGAQDIHHRWFVQNASPDAQVENISNSRTGFQIAGPKARDLLKTCTRDDVDGIKFLDVRRMTVGQVACIVQRVSFTGDLGFEIYCDPADQRQLWWTLWTAGQPIGIAPFGMRAMMSLRLDRFFGSWQREFSPDYTAAETGIDRFISFKKNVDFIGRAAVEAERVNPPARTLVTFEVDADDSDVVAYEPVFINGEVKGFCTSGGYSHHADKSIAFALIPRADASDDLEAQIEIMGSLRKATRISTPLFDPDGAAMRG